MALLATTGEVRAALVVLAVALCVAGTVFGGLAGRRRMRAFDVFVEELRATVRAFAEATGGRIEESEWMPSVHLVADGLDVRLTIDYLVRTESGQASTLICVKRPEGRAWRGRRLAPRRRPPPDADLRSEEAFKRGFRGISAHDVPEHVRAVMLRLAQEGCDLELDGDELIMSATARDAATGKLTPVTDVDRQRELVGATAWIARELSAPAR